MDKRYESVEQDIKLAQVLLFQAAQCVDRVHRSMFLGQEQWQENMMVLGEKTQRDLRHARRHLQRMRLLEENWTKDRGTSSTSPLHTDTDASAGRLESSARVV